MKTTNLKKLHQEFTQLKKEIFGNCSFAEVQDTKKQKRYDQLFQFFYPQFRTKNFINPIKN